MRITGPRAAVGLTLAALVLAACSSATAEEPSSAAAASGSAPADASAAPSPVASAGVQPVVNREIRIGSLEYPGSRLMAEVYGRALKDAGYTVRLTVPSTEETFTEAMEKGQVDIVPVFVGPYADALFGAANGPGAARAVTVDLPSTLAAANALAAPRGVEVLDATPGAEGAAVVVSREFAQRTGVSTVSGLAVHSRLNGALRLGAQSSCEVVVFCRPNLEKNYQMRIREFVPLSADGRVVREALADGSIDVGVLPASDPELTRQELVTLGQDIPLTYFGNIAPAVRSAFATPEVVDILNRATAGMTAEQLGLMTRTFQQRVAPIGRVAGDYVAAQGLGPGLYDKPLPVIGVVIPRTVDTSAPTASATTPPVAGGPLRISYAPLFETEIVARIYAAALASAGIPVTVGDPLEPIDLLAELRTGEVQLAPMRLNVVASDLQAEEDGPLQLPVTTRSVADLLRLSRDLALERGMSIMEPTAAAVTNAFVVSDDFAKRTGVSTLSELAEYSQTTPVLVGAPPTCADESWCLPYLEDGYGIVVQRFLPLDFGGGLTRAAVDGGDVDVAWLSGNDGGIEQFGLRQLADDRGLEPVNPIAPILNQASVNPDVARVITRVSREITSDDLQEMNHRVEFEREELTDVVDEFLAKHDLQEIPLAG